MTKLFHKVVKTKEEMAEIMYRPLNIPEKYKQKCIDSLLKMSNAEFIKEARHATDLDVCVFINNRVIIRYEYN